MAAETFCFHIWGPKHVRHQAPLQKTRSEVMHFSAETPFPSLGVDGPGLPGRNSIECPVTPRCCRHMLSSQLGSPRWSASSSIEIQSGYDPTFFSVPSPTPLRTSPLATYCDTKFCSIPDTTLRYPSRVLWAEGSRWLTLP